MLFIRKKGVFTLSATIVLFFTFTQVLSQNNTIFTNYDKKDYKGGNQNWSICVGEAQMLFAANNQGLLFYNGASWNLKRIPNNAPVRSVLYDNHRIYIGTFEDFGYFELENNKLSEYQSLAGNFKNSFKNQEFWRIVKQDGYIFFQSFGSILYFNGKVTQRLNFNFPILLLMQAGNQLFAQEINGGLYRVSATGMEYLEGSNIFSSTEVKSAVKINDNVIFCTNTQGLYRYDGKNFSQWKTAIDKELLNSNLNNATIISKGIAIGTILKGIYVIDYSGNLKYHIDSKFIQNNTILALSSDKLGNLWVAKDKGISYIAFNSPITTYIDEDEKFSCYSACLYNNQLYLATNQGIYCHALDKKGNVVSKEIIKGTQGQAWFVKQIEASLYFGLNNGTYQYEDNKLIKLANVSGGYNLEKFQPDNNIYIQSTYSNLVTYKIVDSKLKLNKVIPSYSSPSHFMQIDFQHNIWLGHSINGMVKIQVNNTVDSIINVDTIGEKNNLKKKINKIYKLDNRIVTVSETGILRWDDIHEKFVKYDELNRQLQGFENCNAIISLPNSKYWLIKDDEWGLFEIRYSKANLLYRIIPDMYGIEMVEGYENIVQLNDSLELICLDNGFALLNLLQLNRITEVNLPPYVTELSSWNEKEKPHYNILTQKQTYRIPWKRNNISVSFASKDLIGVKRYFQYKMTGVDTDWSQWVTTTSVDYKRLPPGNYQFIVHTINSKGLKTPNTEVNFVILSPFFLSWKASIIYVTFIVLIFLVSRKKYKQQLKKQFDQKRKEELQKIKSEREEREKVIVKLQNDRLHDEVENKASQLAMNTMAIIRKNQLLREISSELEKMKKDLGYRIPNKYYTRIVKLITQNFKDEQEWDAFEKLFDQAHHNFFKRLKDNFPLLTSSDLRLCAYLRMHLSSKEIAPLLNISLRGVEERRYRLRKRLNLPSDENLNDFIINF